MRSAEPITNWRGRLSRPMPVVSNAESGGEINDNALARFNWPSPRRIAAAPVTVAPHVMPVSQQVQTRGHVLARGAALFRCALPEGSEVEPQRRHAVLRQRLADGIGQQGVHRSAEQGVPVAHYRARKRWSGIEGRTEHSVHTVAADFEFNCGLSQGITVGIDCNRIGRG